MVSRILLVLSIFSCLLGNSISIKFKGRDNSQRTSPCAARMKRSMITSEDLLCNRLDLRSFIEENMLLSSTASRVSVSRVFGEGALVVCGEDHFEVTSNYGMHFCSATVNNHTCHAFSLIHTYL